MKEKPFNFCFNRIEQPCSSPKFINIYELKYYFIVANETIAIDLEIRLENIRPYQTMQDCIPVLTTSWICNTIPIVVHAQLCTLYTFYMNCSVHTHNLPGKKHGEHEVEARAFEI